MKLLKSICVSVGCLTFAACSGSNGPSSVTPPIVAVNIPPVAQDTSGSFQQDSTNNEITLLGTDADGDTLTYTIGSQPSSGTLSLSGSTASYTPNTGFSGTDSFTYTVNDGTAGSNTATVSITVIASSGFSGKTISTSGSAVPNVQIELLDAAGVLSSTVTSNGSGDFEVSGETGTPFTLRFTSPGYATQVAVVTLPDLPAGTLPLDITMISRPAAQSADVDMGGVVSDAQGASVTIAPGSFVDADGNAVSGNIDVTITPVNTVDPTIFPSFPGEFSGLEEATGQVTTIATLGTVEYTFSQGGNPLQLGTGQTAQIEMPLWSSINPQNGNRIEAGDVIPLWSLNETTGTWEQEGSGTVAFNLNSPTGYVLEATVSHFTWWNIDYPLPSAEVEVTLSSTTTAQGLGTVKARTDAPGFRVAQKSVLSGGAPITGRIPANYEACFWVEFVDTSGNRARTSDQCINNPVADASYPLNFSINASDSLTLNPPSNLTAYLESAPIRFTISPATLESSVTYAVTAGTLPTGLTLMPDRSIYTDVTGSVATPGSYQFTITGTDAGGSTDNVIVAFDVTAATVPVLDSNQGGLYAPGSPVMRQTTVQTPGSSPITTFSVVNADGSSVRPGVSISSAGLFTMDTFMGGTELFAVRAYNASGPSDIITLTITDNFGQQ